jgi:hypothetical protein
VGVARCARQESNLRPLLFGWASGAANDVAARCREASVGPSLGRRECVDDSHDVAPVQMRSGMGITEWMGLLAVTTRAPAGLLQLERRLAMWEPLEPGDSPPAADVWRYVVEKRRWEDADRRAWERAGRPGDFVPAWKLEVDLRRLVTAPGRQN